MRLKERHVEQIKALVAEQFGPDVELRLFGSRANDAGRGGDVDLFIRSSRIVDRPALVSSALAARISRMLEGRRVDVVIDAPNLERLPIHDVASSQGVRL